MQSADFQRSEQIFASISAQLARGMEIDEEAWIQSFPEKRRDLQEFFRLFKLFGPSSQVDDRLPDLGFDSSQLTRLQQVVWEDAESDFVTTSESDNDNETFENGSPRVHNQKLAIAHQDSALTPQKLGSYTLIRKLAEGGMGAVWLAEQVEPVQRQVAIKLIRSELRDDRLIRRFHSERQALARMSHPNIAQIFNADSTQDGTPYFVMEYVDGKSIAEFCHEQKLPLKDRLHLFLDVCEAVEHAHRKGVLHLDLKPSNVLVTQNDGKPMVKVVDFGISKLLNTANDDFESTSTSSSEPKQTTEHDQVVGTLAYMSPEQADSNSRDIDTRSDLYSLGVLLFQLLTGETPIRFDKNEPLEVAIDRLQHQSPELASSRLKRMLKEGNSSLPFTSPQLMPSIAAMEQDVDWVIAKAIRKNREERYKDVGSFSQDLRRFLAHEPVAAREGSKLYFARKWISKRKLLVGATAICICTLLAGLIGTSIGLRDALAQRSVSEQAKTRAESSERQAIEQKAAAESNLQRALKSESLSAKQAEDLRRVVAFQSEQLGSIDIHRMAETIAKAVSTRVGNGPLQALDLSRKILGECLFQPFAVNALTQFPDQPDLAFEVLTALSLNEIQIGLYSSARETSESALEIAKKHFGETDRRTGIALRVFGHALQLSGNGNEAESYTRMAIENLGKCYGEDHLETLAAKSNLGGILLEGGHLEQAQEMFEEVYESKNRTLGDSHAETLLSLNNLAGVLHSRSNWDEAEVLHRKCYLAQLQRLGPSHQETLTSQNNLAFVLKRLGRLTEANQLLQDAYLACRNEFGDEHPLTLTFLTNVGMSLRNQGNAIEAKPKLEEVLTLRTKILGPNHSDTLIAVNNLAAIHRDMKNTDEALAMQKDLVDTAIESLGWENPLTLQFLETLCHDLRSQSQAKELSELLLRLTSLSSSETISELSLNRVNEILKEFNPRP